MPSNPLSEEMLENIDPNVVENYVEITGWRRILETPSHVSLFQRYNSDGKGDIQEILIPRQKQYADFSARMSDVIEMLGMVENRTPLEVMTTVLTPSDILRFRIISDETTNGVLPFLEGVSLLNGMKRAFLAAACDIIKPQSYHPKLSRKEAEDYLSGCRLGQTTVGSYVATVLCPLDAILKDASNQQDSLFPEISRPQFKRGVTARVMQSLEEIRTQLDKENIKGLIDPEDNDLRISGNFFEALVDMQSEQNKSSLSVSVSWSSTFSSQVPLPSEVMLPERYFPIIEEVAEYLRPDYHPEEREIIGKVIALSGEQDEQELMKGEVYIRFLEDDQLVDARVELASKEYEIACDAHKLGKYVRVLGTLARQRRSYVITEYRNFNLLPLVTFGNDVQKKYLRRAQETWKRRQKK